MNKKQLIKNIIILQAIIALYSLSTVMSKFAAEEDFLSFKFILFYGIEILILGVYAILWQQIIKKFDISVASANKAMAILWSMLWAILFFHDNITANNIIGIVIIIMGTFIVNSGETEKEKVVANSKVDKIEKAEQTVDNINEKVVDKK